MQCWKENERRHRWYSSCQSNGQLGMLVCTTLNLYLCLECTSQKSAQKYLFSLTQLHTILCRVTVGSGNTSSLPLFTLWDCRNVVSAKADDSPLTSTPLGSFPCHRRARSKSPWHALLTLIPYFLSGNGPVLWLYRQSTVCAQGCSVRLCHRC